MGSHHRNRPLRRNRPTALAWLAALALTGACAEPPAGGALDVLFSGVTGEFLHISSFDTTGGNRDRYEIAPGDSAVLLERAGPGVIRRIWVTVASRDPQVYRRIALRMYWDDETTPSVSVPLGDFFGNAWDRRHWSSQVMGATSGGWFSYFPMPFRRRARIVVENGSDLPVDAFYFNADLDTGVDLPRDVATFHATWNRDARTSSGLPHRVLTARGSGRFVGLVFNAESHAGNLTFLEGDEIFHVDGEFRGQGTGTEDYFNAGWYFEQGPFAAPYHGLIIKDDTLGRIAAYRWHVPDPVQFRDSIRIDLEHGHANEEVADYATVAYWYQSEPHVPFAPLPAPPDRTTWAVKLPPGALVGDSLRRRPGPDGAIVTLPVPRPDLYEVIVWPNGAVRAAPVTLSVAGRGKRQTVSRDADSPGPLPPVAIDTLAIVTPAVEILAAGPDALAAVSAAQLRPVRSFGREWSVRGPYPNPQRLGTEYSVALDSATARGAERAPPSMAPDSAPAGWRPATAGADGQVRLNPLFRPADQVAAYALAWLHAPTARDAVLLLGADDGHVLWINGVEVSRRQGRNISRPDDVVVPVRLRAGWNRVLLLVADLDGGWGFHLRAADPTGELRWAREARFGAGGETAR